MGKLHEVLLFICLFEVFLFITISPSSADGSCYQEVPVLLMVPIP